MAKSRKAKTTPKPTSLGSEQDLSELDNATVDWFRILNNMTAESLGAFIAYQEKWIEREQKNLDKKVQSQAKKLSDEARGYLYGYEDEVYNVTEELPQLTRQSCFLMIYGSFENALSSFCHAVFADHGERCQLTKPGQRMDIKASREYLRTKCEFSEAPLDEALKPFRALTTTRDYVTHGGAVVRDSDTSGNADMIREYAKTSSSLHIDGYRRIVLTSKFNSKLLNAFQDSFRKLLRLEKSLRTDSSS